MATAKKIGIDYNAIFGKTHAAIEGGATHAAAVKEAAPALRGGSLTEQITLFLKGETMKDGISAAQEAAALQVRSLLKKQRVDVDVRADVANALRSEVWAHYGHAEPVAKADDKALYDRVAKRLGRLVRAVLGEKAAQTVAKQVRVPRVVQSSIDALIAEHGVAAVRAALKRAK